VACARCIHRPRLRGRGDPKAVAATEIPWPGREADADAPIRARL